MCNLSKGVRDEGIDIGIEKGRSLKSVEIVNSMLEEGIPFEQALRIAKIDKETYEKINREGK